MLQRRVVMKLGALLLTLPASRVLLGCDDDDNDNDDRDGGNGARDAGQGDGGADAGTDAGTDAGEDAGTQPLTFTSSTVNGHTHTFTIQATELSDSPASGVSRETSLEMGHTHNVELSEVELDEIEAGGTVTVTTSIVNGHSHTFEFTRM